MILFRDRITAFHMVKETLDDGSTREVRGEAFIRDAPCQISHASDDRGMPKAKDRIPQERAMKVFVWLDAMPEGESFRQGDYIRAERTDRKGNVAEAIEGTIGKPNVFTRGIAHAEISLEAK